jgi:hypothetical protein
MKLLLALLAVGFAGANPIGKIVSLLNDMKAKIGAEGEHSLKTHTEYKEWSRSEIQATEHAISRNQDNVDAAKACISDSAAKAQEHEATIGELTASSARNEKELAEARELRATQHKDFQAAEGDLRDTIDALMRAASIIRRGGGALAQVRASLTQIAGMLSTIMDAAAIDAADKTKLQAFVQKAKDADDDDDGGFVQPTAAAYSGHSSNIVDVLADLKVKAETELSDLRKEEMQRKHAFDMLAQSLTDANSVASRDLKSNQAGLAEQQEANGRCSGALADESSQLSANQKYLTDLGNQAEAEAQEHEASTKSRSEELAAISKAIEILTGDNFQAATNRRMQLVQLKARGDPRAKAADLIRSVSRKFHSVGLAQLAIRVAEDPFAKVKGLIEQMIGRLQKQAAEESDRKAYCDKENRESAAKRDDQSAKLDNFQARLEQSRADEASTKQNVAELSGEIADLDAALAQRTKIRQEENRAFVAAAEDHRVGLEGLNQALQVLREYYASSGKAHAAKSDSSTGVISMLEVAEADMTRMQAESQMAEETAARDYNTFKQEAEVSRASKAAAVKAKNQELARLGSMISDLKSDSDGMNAELTSTLNYIEKLKQTCVHKPQTFAERAAKLQQEIQGLREALRILDEETADSFLQRRK